MQRNIFDRAEFRNGGKASSSLFEEDSELAREVIIRSSEVKRSRSGRYYGQSLRPLTE